MPVQTRSASRKAGHASPASPTPNSQNQESPLLTLPAELRNEIYHLALVETEKIQISEVQPPPQQPGLLSVSKQIRKEALSIYYKENTFRFRIQDFDIAALLQWRAMSPEHKTCHVSYSIVDSHNWPKLLAWLQAFYEGRCGKVGERYSKSACLVHSLFSMVREMKVVQGMKWEQVAKNLEYVHQGLIATKSGWQ